MRNFQILIVSAVKICKCLQIAPVPYPGCTLNTTGDFRPPNSLSYTPNKKFLTPAKRVNRRRIDWIQAWATQYFVT